MDGPGPTETVDLRDVEPASIPDSYGRLGFDALSDEALVDRVAHAVARPKVDPPTSFVLHAPLEVLARKALLGYVSPPARDPARQRLLWVGATYAAAGSEVAPLDRADFDRPERATDALTTAVDGGEVDDADRAISWLVRTHEPATVARALADLVLPRLSAAGHGNILLYLLLRAAPTSRPAAASLRGLARAIAGAPDWTLTWHVGRHIARGASAAPAELEGVLAAPRSPGELDSNFIHPTMSLVESSGLAAELLDGPTRALAVDAAQRSLLRTAAASMVQDDPDHAPYGWSHCLTMPQAALAMAPFVEDPDDAVAVAATYVLGFRATLSRAPVDVHAVPDRIGGDPLDAQDGSPGEAAAAAWHAPADRIGALATRLADRAAAHPDAHLAKYTLACFDAAATDPDAAPRYLAAAAFLGAWWDQLPLDDPLVG